MDKEVMEIALKRCARECKITKVLTVESELAVAKGENYTSDIRRLHLKVILGNGRLANRSFIVKKLITTTTCGQLFKEQGLPTIESDMFFSIHKEMYYLMQEFDDTDETLWCDVLYSDLSSGTLLFEDLKPIGYKVVPRQEGLDLEHSLLAVRGVAKYHGMMKVLEERGMVSKDKYGTFFLLSNRDNLKMWIYNGIRQVAKVMKESWNPNCAEMADKLLDIDFNIFAAKMLPLGIPIESDFTVLNHGDCWSNNMMFKYDWRGRPISVKLIDHQGPHYNSPCIDLTYFIYMSIKPPIRRQNTPVLVQTYHECLISTLEKFGYSGSRPSIEEVTAKMERLSLFGSAMFIFGHSIRACNSAEPLDYDKVVQSGGESGFNKAILLEPGMEESMVPDIEDFVEAYLPMQ